MSEDTGHELKVYQCQGCDALLSKESLVIDYSTGEGKCPCCSGSVEEIKENAKR
jgi:hypothetical protein